MESKLEIRCGKSTDSYERLMELCRNEANKVVTELQNADSMKVEIEFWTDEQPAEFICVCRFERDESGNVSYSMDDSASTL